MPALDSTRKVYHPIENRFVPVGDNVQFIAAVNRGSEFSATFGIDAAQLDRFAPLQMDYLPPLEEIKLLGRKHPELSKSIIQIVVAIANRLRTMQELSAGLSVRATDEVCVYLKHPLLENEQVHHLDEILKSSFCGRYNGRWNDSSSDAGMAWSVIKNALKDVSKLKIGE
jgi:MoxR-like ATPase